MNRLPQLVLITSTLLASWLGMQAIHEAGHVLGAWLTDGRVEKVVLHPLTISRTDLSANPHPLSVVWAGPTFGVAAPLILWAIASALLLNWTFLLRFFAGFCLLANGLYIGLGSFNRVGDCGQMLQHGSQSWHLWLFGALTAPIGLLLWHHQGPHFGLGSANGQVSRGTAYGCLTLCLALLVLEVILGGGR